MFLEEDADDAENQEEAVGVVKMVEVDFTPINKVTMALLAHRSKAPATRATKSVTNPWIRRVLNYKNKTSEPR